MADGFLHKIKTNYLENKLLGIYDVFKMFSAIAVSLDFEQKCWCKQETAFLPYRSPSGAL